MQRSDRSIYPRKVSTVHSTSWSPVATWYTKLVGESGSYFHEHIIIPKTLALLSLNDTSSLLDVGCGEGVLARAIPKNVAYTGMDISGNLISEAKKRDHNPRHTYQLVDVTQNFQMNQGLYSHAVFLLSLQNMEQGEGAISNIAKMLKPNGILVLVLNHPCFRIPRQTSWGIDEKNKMQYRRINRYYSPLKIPITAHPGQKTSPVTWSYHYPISEYTKWLYKNNFNIQLIEEWMSDKESEGTARRMENRSRSEFPLFLAMKVVKQ